MEKEWLDELERKPVFTLNDASRLTGREKDSLKVTLHRMVERGRINRVERGKYSFHDDAMIVASHLIYPSYISLWAALQHYGYTTQLPKAVNVMVSEYKEDIMFGDKEIKFTETGNMYGYRKEDYRGHQIEIAEPEKLLIDCLSTHKVPVRELESLLEDLDHGKAARYAIKTGKNSVIKRSGYLLSGKDVEVLKEHIDNNYVLLDPEMSERGDKDREWKVIDNR